MLTRYLHKSRRMAAFVVVAAFSCTPAIQAGNTEEPLGSSDNTKYDCMEYDNAAYASDDIGGRGRHYPENQRYQHPLRNQHSKQMKRKISRASSSTVALRTISVFRSFKQEKE